MTNTNSTALSLAFVFGTSLDGTNKLSTWHAQREADGDFNEHMDLLDFFEDLGAELDKQADWEATHDWYRAVDTLVENIPLLSDLYAASLAELVRLTLALDTVQQ